MAVTTGSLIQKLSKTKNIKRFISANKDSLGCEQINVYLTKLCNDKGITVTQAIADSGIERTYGHQLFNGTRKPSRDKLILLALSMGLDFEETQNLLKIARKSALYAKIERDIVFIYAFNNKLSVSDVQMTLEELNLSLLGDEYGHE